MSNATEAREHYNRLLIVTTERNAATLTARRYPDVNDETYRIKEATT